MQEIKTDKQESQNSTKLFEITWAELDEYFLLVWAKDREEALRVWQQRYKEHWCAELSGREFVSRPFIGEMSE